jgi:hypothetical protein
VAENRMKMLFENDLLIKPDPHIRYARYMERCEQILVRPASFDLWKQIEPWLIARGQIAVLEVLRADLLGNSRDRRAFSEAFAS